MNKNSILFLGLLLIAANLSYSQVFIDENFDNDTVGGSPTVNTLILTPTGTAISVVDSGSTPADPFGGTGNRSFYIEDTDASNTPQLGWGTDPFAGQSGNLIFSTKAYVVNNATFNDTYQVIRIGQNGALGSTLLTTEAGVDFYIQEDRFQVNDGTILTLDQAPGDTGLELNTVWDIQMSISVSTHTYSISINDIRLTDASGTISSFGFRNDLDINYVSFIGLSTNNATRVFYDDVYLTSVPEESNTAIFFSAFAIIACLFTRRILKAKNS